MFSYKADKQKNILEFHFEGEFEDLDVAKAANAIKAEIDSLKPGFAIISDISRLETCDDMYIPIIREVMEFLGKHNPGHVIRIVGNELPDQNFQKAWNNEHVDYKVTRVSSYEEALALLEQ